jgi:acyl carrier protein
MPPTPTVPDFATDALRGFPDGTVRAVEAFYAGRTRSTLDAAVRAVLEFYLPQASRRSLADVPGTLRLREDLGIDSLTMAEAVFKWDDMFGTSIETREAARLGTLDDLLEFLALKTGLAGLTDSHS